MSIDWTGIATVAPIAFGLVGGMWALKEHRAKKKAEAEARTAESELRQMRRRGDAPFLRPSKARFGTLYRAAGNGSISAYRAGSTGSMLCELLDEIGELPDGNEVVFVIEHSGANARSIVVRLDGERITIEQEAEIDSSHGLCFLAYPYKKSKHGQEQKISVSFETENGSQDTHIYLTRHGCRVLHRIDPPLP